MDSLSPHLSISLDLYQDPLILRAVSGRKPPPEVPDPTRPPSPDHNEGEGDAERRARAGAIPPGPRTLHPTAVQRPTTQPAKRLGTAMNVRAASPEDTEPDALDPDHRTPVGSGRPAIDPGVLRQLPLELQREIERDAAAHVQGFGGRYVHASDNKGPLAVQHLPI